MTVKADFTEEEWELVLDGPPTAGLVALAASRPEGFREDWTIVGIYADARQARGESELLDDLIAELPNLERYAWPEQAELEGLARLAEAVMLLERKASPARWSGTSTSPSPSPLGLRKSTRRSGRSAASASRTAKRST